MTAPASGLLLALRVESRVIPSTNAVRMNHVARCSSLFLPVLIWLLQGCGGGDKGTGPASVVRVDVTAPSSSLELGKTMRVTARYYNAQSGELTGRPVSWTSSSALIASVSQDGLVTAAGTGRVVISATVDGVRGSVDIDVVPVPVAQIAITPANPSVRLGETITLNGTPRDAMGQPLTDRRVSWSSADPLKATVDTNGVVTGVAAGYVYIRASTGERTDSVNLRVRNLLLPSITAGPTGELVPGATATLTGVNFGATVSANEVYVNGAKGTVTGATPTSVTFTVPAATALPCTATGPAAITLVVNGDSASSSATLRVATARSLAVGESLLLTAPADLTCNEFLGSGGKYLITAFNHASNAGVRVSFRLTGNSPSMVQAVTAAPALNPMEAPGSPPRRGAVQLNDPFVRHLRAHSVFREQDRELGRRLGNPGLRSRAELRKAKAGFRSLAAIQPPAVGEFRSFRMRRTLASVSDFDEVDFRVVYSGSKMVILEDAASPLAGQMDQEFVKLGQEFDNVMYDLLLEFGDPLVVDSALDDNGRMLALFSPRVNGYTVNGVSNQVMGFVSLCDFFPREPETLPDGTVVQPCPASNEGEVFYALVPDPSGGWSTPLWRRLMRGTLIHEAKHIVSYAYRYYLEGDVANLEETWLEEATAQVASELWARTLYHQNQRDDITWEDGPRCDYAAESPACPDPAEGILHHFAFLYDHYSESEQKSILDTPGGGVDPVIYGSSWSFVRWVTDNYSANEPDLLSALIQVKNDHGVANLEDKTGKPFSELLGLWSLASLADNYPGAVINDPRLRLASWQSRDLFLNMSRNLRSNGEVIFPLEWPLQVRQASFGPFGPLVSDVTGLRGGGFISWELGGVQLGPQALAIRSTTGGAPPPFMGMAIVRIQ